jgi:hypothetical protein
LSDETVIGPIALGDLLIDLPRKVPEDTSRFIIYMDVNSEPILSSSMCYVVGFPPDSPVTIDDLRYYMGKIAICDLNMACNVVEITLNNTPTSSQDELVDALNYYLDNDAYLEN